MSIELIWGLMLALAALICGHVAARRDASGRDGLDYCFCAVFAGFGAVGVTWEFLAAPITSGIWAFIPKGDEGLRLITWLLACAASLGLMAAALPLIGVATAPRKS